jgi:hypothetical protein
VNIGAHQVRVAGQHTHCPSAARLRRMKRRLIRRTVYRSSSSLPVSTIMALALRSTEPHLGLLLMLSTLINRPTVY